MKGIILAGGTGSRLYPMTTVTSKQLQPVYDKPMIYYPLTFLMLGGIREILMITTPHDKPAFEKLLGDGSRVGIKITYKIQEKPTGLPDAFTLGADFIGDDDCCLILGDNLFYGGVQFFKDALAEQKAKANGFSARVFAYYVSDPSAYGVVEFEKSTGKVKSIEEKPKVPRSNYAIPGLYIFDKTIAARAKDLKPSARGETEIVDLIKQYHAEGSLAVKTMTRGVAWLDTGTPRSLLDASAFIGAIEERQGLKVACLEEVAYRANFINLEQLKNISESLPKSSYRSYLEKLVTEFA